MVLDGGAEAQDRALLCVELMVLARRFSVSKCSNLKGNHVKFISQ